MLKGFEKIIWSKCLKFVCALRMLNISTSNVRNISKQFHFAIYHISFPCRFWPPFIWRFGYSFHSLLFTLYSSYLTRFSITSESFPLLSAQEKKMVYPFEDSVLTQHTYKKYSNMNIADCHSYSHSHSCCHYNKRTPNK